MALVTLIQTKDQDVNLFQSKLKSTLDPLLSNLLTQGILLTNVDLASGATTINHLLGRKMVGYVVTDLDADASIYRSQPLNDKTLTLTSSAACTVSLWVF
jgi:hypothetical protein